MHCAWPGDYHSLSLTRIQFHPRKVTPLTNTAKVTAQGLCSCNSDAWGRHNSYKSGVIGITEQLIRENGKSSKVYRRNNNGLKTLPCSTTDTRFTSLLRQESSTTCCDRFDRNCVNIDNTEPPIPPEQTYQRIRWWLTLLKAALKSICTILASCPLWDTYQRESQDPDLSDKQTGWLEAHHCIP